MFYLRPQVIPSLQIDENLQNLPAELVTVEASRGVLFYNKRRKHCRVFVFRQSGLALRIISNSYNTKPSGNRTAGFFLTS